MDEIDNSTIEEGQSTGRVTRKRTRSQAKGASPGVASASQTKSTTPKITDGMSDEDFEKLIASGALSDDVFEVAAAPEDTPKPAKKQKQATATAKKKSNQTLTQRISKLFYKNGPFAKMSDTELRTVFCAAALRKLSPEERRSLAAFLPKEDIDSSTGEPDEQIFYDPSLRNSIDTFQSMVGQGWMLPSRNLRSTLETIVEQSQDAGSAAPRMKEFWLDNVDQMNMKWVSDLKEGNASAGSSSTEPAKTDIVDLVDDEEQR